MGVKKLAELIKKQAPNSIKKKKIQEFKGKILACDSPIFLTMTHNYSGQMSRTLTDKNQNPTAHLLGLMSRSLQMVENQIQPYFIFDGEAPVEKFDELERRTNLKKDSIKQLEETEQKFNTSIPKLQQQKKKLREKQKSQIEGLNEDQIQEKNQIEKELKRLISLQSRTVFITDKMRQDAFTLLNLLGIPYLIGPGEAEAQCSELVKSNKCYATVTEDMDSILFKSSKVLRNFNSKVEKEGVQEFDYQEIIKGLGISENQFLDLCILMGTDFCETIKNIGPVKALKLIKEYGSIEEIINNIDTLNKGKNKLKYQIPENFQYEKTRTIFQQPLVTDTTNINIEQNQIQIQELQEFLIQEKNFSNQRVQSYISRFQKSIDQMV